MANKKVSADRFRNQFKVTVRLNELQETVEKHAEKAGLTVSQWVRQVIADRLKTDCPQVVLGRPKIDKENNLKK
jgi:predicted HicB family RNase H-like nuclease